MEHSQPKNLPSVVTSLLVATATMVGAPGSSQAADQVERSKQRFSQCASLLPGDRNWATEVTVVSSPPEELSAEFSITDHTDSDTPELTKKVDQFAYCVASLAGLHRSSRLQFSFGVRSGPTEGMMPGRHEVTPYTSGGTARPSLRPTLENCTELLSKSEWKFSISVDMRGRSGRTAVTNWRVDLSGANERVLKRNQVQLSRCIQGALALEPDRSAEGTGNAEEGRP